MLRNLSCGERFKILIIVADYREHRKYEVRDFVQRRPNVLNTVTTVQECDARKVEETSVAGNKKNEME